jgi:hypothetical protein
VFSNYLVVFSDAHVIFDFLEQSALMGRWKVADGTLKGGPA